MSSGMLKLVLGGEVYQRKASTWSEAQKAIDELIEAQTERRKPWVSQYEDHEGDKIVVRSDTDWDCFMESIAAHPHQRIPKLFIRITPESQLPSRTIIDIDSRLEHKYHTYKLKLNYTNDQLLQFLFTRLEGGASPLFRLPSEVHAQILLYLPVLDMRRMGAVCSAWRSLLRTHELLQLHLATFGLYVVGGINNSQSESSRATTLRAVVKYNPTLPNSKWSTVCSMNVERYHCGTALYDRLIYVVGGRNATQRLNSAEVYDPLRNEWSELPPMRSVRSAPACAVHKEGIYVFGGFDGETEFRTVERYNPHTRRWAEEQDIAPMPHEACELGAVSLGAHVYVIGGTQSRHSPEEKVLPLVQRYDPETNAWSVLPPMSTKRMCPATVAFQGKLWVIGGSDGQTALNTVECYDPATESWEKGPSMSTYRSNATATVVQGCIYVTGGFYAENGGPLNSVERYDVRRGWSQVRSMPEKRDACKVLTWE